MPQEDSIVLKAKVESPLPTTLSWSVKGNEVSKDTVFTFKMNELGTYDVKLTATNADGVTSATTSIEVYGKYKYGTFVLNEGYQADPSTLIFISPKGILTDSAYYKANGSMLSLLSQDLFIANNKLYIISQKSGDDGYLIVANAETLKKEAGYKTELEDKVSSPTHVAVLGDLSQAFSETTEGRWLARHAPLYGFIIRYPKGKEHLTKIPAEPWHIRYVTRSLALCLTLTGQVLEEYYACCER